MIYGAIFGLSLIVGALIGISWWGAVIGLIIDLLVFLWEQYGERVMKKWEMWQKSSVVSISTGTSAEQRTTRITRWFQKEKSWVLWPIFLIIAVWFVGTYQGRVTLEKAFLNIVAMISGGEYLEYQFTTLEPQEFVAPAPGRWRFEVVDQKEYRYKCPGWKGERSGYLKKVRGHQVAYAQPLNEYPFQEEGYPGALLIYSEASRNNPRPDNQEFIIGENRKFFIGPNLTREEKRCDVAIPAPVKFILYRIE